VGAAQPSLASNYVALAFALVIPFAQQYSQPWLHISARPQSVQADWVF
jgi:hypothetical protein